MKFARWIVLAGVAVAVSGCGWRSENAMNAGMAGAMWDKHLEEMIIGAD